MRRPKQHNGIVLLTSSGLLINNKGMVKIKNEAAYREALKRVEQLEELVVAFNGEQIISSLY